VEIFFQNFLLLGRVLINKKTIKNEVNFFIKKPT
jgi:hypothetical protein